MRGLDGLSIYALPPAEEWCADPNIPPLPADPFVLAPLRGCDEVESVCPDLARELVDPNEAGVLLAACRERGRLRLLGLPGAAPDPEGPLSFESVPALPAVADEGIVRDVTEDDDFADFEDRERDDFSAVNEVPASSSEAIPACSWFRFQAVCEDEMPLLGLATALVDGVEAESLALLLGLAEGVRSWRRRRVREGSSDPEGELGADFFVERAD